jgi:hypothetical protein
MTGSGSKFERKHGALRNTGLVPDLLEEVFYGDR